MDKCARCQVDMSRGVLPVVTDGKRLCPQCFVWNYAHEHGNRWDTRVLAAVCCKRCGTLSVDFGRKVCAKCNDNKLIPLGAK